MNHDIREALRNLVAAMNRYRDVLPTGTKEERARASAAETIALIHAREALAALDREGEGEPWSCSLDQDCRTAFYCKSDPHCATPPAAERDVSGWAPELREIAAAIPQSVHDEVAREAAAEREGDGKVPEVVRSAPERIWLQVSDDGYGVDETFPANDEGVTWCRDSVVACEVEYVRADLCIDMIEAAERQEAAE